MAQAKLIKLSQDYIAHLDNDDNHQALVRLSKLSDLLVARLRAKELITDEEAGKIKSVSEADHYGRGLKFLDIIRSDGLRFATREKIADLIAVFEDTAHPRLTVASVFSSFRDEHLKPYDAAQVDGEGQVDVIRSERIGSSEPISIEKIRNSQEFTVGVIAGDGAVLNGSVNINLAKAKTIYKN